MKTEKRRLHATDAGLASAKIAAEKLGLTYDPEQIVEDVPRLAEYYYLDICRVLTPYVKDIQFDQYIEITKFPNAKAYYTPYKDKAIFFDQLLELSVGNLFFQILTLTFASLTKAEIDEITALLENTLKSFGDNQALKKNFHTLFIKQIEPTGIIHLHHSMTITVIIFILCHEIAHHYLSHLDYAQSKAQELEADKLAYEWLIIISQHIDDLQYARVGNNMLCAPIIYKRLLNIREEIGIGLPDKATHPSSLERANQLLPMFEKATGQEGVNLYEGICSALAALKEDLI